MSFLPSDITVYAATALRLLSPILFLQRNIGGFVADVTIEEDHTDELVVTEHPVERGAAITDHAYKRPSQVVINVGWSNSSLAALGNPFYVQLVYSAILALQESRVPFTITTGKRVYENMLITRISARTDEKSENALMASIECREVIIADTQTVSSGNSQNMNNPVENASTADRGTNALIERQSIPNIPGTSVAAPLGS